MPSNFFNDEQLFEWLQVCRTLQCLKELTRQGSVASGLSRADSDSIAAHTCLVGIISLLMAWSLKKHDALDIDPSHVASLALVHDLSSAILGDINSEVKHHYFPEYQKGERLAFIDLVGELQGTNELLKLYDESKACLTTSAKIVRFADGLDAWLEVVPRASLAWMQQHKDYRDRIYLGLKGDEVYGDMLAETFLQVCRVLELHAIGPKRPSMPSSGDYEKDILAKLDGLILGSKELVELLEAYQTSQRLKRMTRQGFIAAGGFNRWDTDSIADHVGLVALMSFTLATELAQLEGSEIEPSHVAAMALIHDIGEAILGDVNSETKHRYFVDYGRSEQMAVKDLLGGISGCRPVLELYDEFDRCETTAAKIVRFADSLDAWQRVTARPSGTWMPQHIEYRNRTFRKLKGDKNYGDALAELFLRACLVVQGQPVGPKRSVSRSDEKSRRFTSQVVSEIGQRINELHNRQQTLRKLLEQNPEQADIQSLARQEDALSTALDEAMQALSELRERLAQLEAKEIKNARPE